MALQTDTGSEAVHPVRPVRTRSDRWAVLAAGVILALLGTGEPHSIAIAAWLAPVFLLRFVRDSRPVLGLGVVALVGVAASVLWSWKIAVISGLPLAAMALSGAMTVLPYIFDRLAGIRLEPIMRLALFPSVIVALEYAQIKLSPFGTIHGLLVDTQLGDLALLQLSSVVGPTGVGFLIGGFATVLNYLWEVRRAGQWVAIVCALTLLFVIGAGSARISFAPIAGKQTVRIAGITPDTDAVLEQYAAAGYPGRAYLIRPPRFDPDSVRQQTRP